jgi:hypothetical protein
VGHNRSFSTAAPIRAPNPEKSRELKNAVDAQESHNVYHSSIGKSLPRRRPLEAWKEKTVLSPAISRARLTQPRTTQGSGRYASEDSGSYNFALPPRRSVLYQIFPHPGIGTHGLQGGGFNITNTANFSTPNATLQNTATFGKVTAMSPAYSPRVFQFALKLVY